MFFSTFWMNGIRLQNGSKRVKIITTFFTRMLFLVQAGVWYKCIHDIHDVMFSLIDTLNQNIWQPLLVAKKFVRTVFSKQRPPENIWECEYRKGKTWKWIKTNQKQMSFSSIFRDFRCLTFWGMGGLILKTSIDVFLT